MDNNRQDMQTPKDQTEKISKKRWTVLIVVLSVVGALLVAVLVVFLTKENTKDIAQNEEPTSNNSSVESAEASLTLAPTLTPASSGAAPSQTSPPIHSDLALVTPIALSTPTPALDLEVVKPLATLKPKTDFVVVPGSNFVIMKKTAAVGTWIGLDNDTVMFILKSDYTFEWYIDGGWDQATYEVGDLYATGTYTFDETTMRGSFVEYYFDFTVAGAILVADPNTLYTRYSN